MFRDNWARSEQKKGVLRALHSVHVPSNMGVPSGFVPYYNLNFIKYLLVIFIFATLAGGHKCISTSCMPKQKWKPTARSKSSKF